MNKRAISNKPVAKYLHLNFFIVLHHNSLMAPHCPTKALWAISTKNPDVSTGPFTCPFANLLTLIIHSLTLALGKVNDWMAIYSVFSILDHSDVVAYLLSYFTK